MVFDFVLLPCLVAGQTFLGFFFSRFLLSDFGWLGGVTDRQDSGQAGMPFGGVAGGQGQAGRDRGCRFGLVAGMRAFFPTFYQRSCLAAHACMGHGTCAALLLTTCLVHTTFQYSLFHFLYSSVRGERGGGGGGSNTLTLNVTYLCISIVGSLGSGHSHMDVRVSPCRFPPFSAWPGTFNFKHSPFISSPSSSLSIKQQDKNKTKQNRTATTTATTKHAR